MPSALLTVVGRRRGIAAGIAAGLAEDGWDLALSYWHPYDQRVGHGGGAHDPDRLGEELRGQNRRIVLVPGDLEDPDVPAKVVNSAVKQLGLPTASPRNTEGHRQPRPVLALQARRVD
jgi:3-oxoacyl-[acyl-carrier protein] reductase